MRRVFKWLAGALALLVALVAVGAGAGYLALTSSIPAANGAMQDGRYSVEARIVRDRHGVPHISAPDMQVAMMALGFAHAQDRLWQMHVLRMVAQGRLSEMFGSPTVATDTYLRTVGLDQSARASFEALSKEGKEALEAYAHGVNLWIGRKTRLLESRLPPEFLILGVDSEPWEPWHSVAILKVMAQTLDSNLGEEIQRLALSRRGLTPREISDLLPANPRDSRPELPDLFQLYGVSRTAGSASLDPGGEDFDLAWPIDQSASNNWVVAGSRTVSGKPLLANDPHLGLTAPGVFYLAHLSFEHRGEKRDVIGGSLPGTPLILVGRNDRVAWGLTTTNLDAQDLYVERIKPDDATQYLTPDGWRPFETQEIEIKVKGGDPVRFVRRSTRHGPVLPDGFRGLSRIVPAGHVAALQWVSLATDDTTVDAALGIGVSRSVGEFMDAARLVVAPMQSMVVADSAGSIALISPGRVPLRDPANPIKGMAPSPGWDPLYDWKGWMAFEDLPRIDNPSSGALATANSNWLPAGYAGFITHDWDEPWRQTRVEELVIGANAPHDGQSMRAIQSDILSPPLVRFRDLALSRLQAGAGQDAQMLAALKAWDGKMDMDRPEPLIVTAWRRHLHIALFSDDLGEDYSRFDSGAVTPVIQVLERGGARDWCDNGATAAREDCGTLLSQALAAATRELEALQGNAWRQWRWGAAHVAFGEHRPFSNVGALSPYFSIQVESAGGPYTLMRGRNDFGDKDHPYRSVHASAYRAWYDLADPSASQYIISTGQSGHFLSPHYADLAPLWARGEYLQMETDPAQYGKDAAGEWVITPSPL
jgi:penicillin amidase